jgi:hypothetical protein
MIQKLVTFILVLSVVTLHSYSILDLKIGSDIANHDARSISLGGTGVAGGFNLLDSSINPANLFFLEDSGNFQLTYSLIKNSENRAIPLWNFFDSYIDASTYARNESFYNEIALGASYSIPFAESKLNLALMMRPVRNFGASYDEEVRTYGSQDYDTYPPVVAKNFIESAGILNSYNLLLNWGMATDFFTLAEEMNISVGVELSYLAGKHEQDTRILWTDFAHGRVAGLPDSLYSYQNEISGIAMKFGASSQVSNRLRVGASFSPKTKLDSEGSHYAICEFKALDIGDYSHITQQFSGDFILPSRWSFGVLYKPRNPFRTNFHVDFEVVNYSEIDPFFDDGYIFRVGMEHYVGYAVPMRLGFSHSTAKQDKSISLPVISAGTGFSIIPNVHLDIAGEYGKREYIALDLFRDDFYDYGNALWGSSWIRPANRGWENPDNVTESFLKIFASLTYRF